MIALKYQRRSSPTAYIRTSVLELIVLKSNIKLILANLLILFDTSVRSS